MQKLEKPNKIATELESDLHLCNACPEVQENIYLPRQLIGNFKILLMVKIGDFKSNISLNPWPEKNI